MGADKWPEMKKNSRLELGTDIIYCLSTIPTTRVTKEP